MQKLRTVNYHVSELDAATEWYIKATGIQPFKEPFYVGFDINGYAIGLDPSSGKLSAGNLQLRIGRLKV